MVSRNSIFLLFVLILLVACNGSGSKNKPGDEPDQLNSSTKTVAQALEPNDNVDNFIERGGELDSSTYVGLAGAQPYYPNGPYADVLANCVTAQSAQFSCSLKTLPFLASENFQPSIDAVLARLVVSHRWMGERFEQALQHMPADVLHLFKAVTAVVIADDIRPSYFATMTGAIYIDPALLWQTQQEKAIFQLFAQQTQTVTGDQPLGFRSWSRYVANGSEALMEFSLVDDSERSINEVIYPLAALLFHELAHANDFFPPEYVVLEDQNLSVYQVASLQKGRRASDLLYEFSPLNSDLLKHFAQVMYLHLGMFNAEDLSMPASDIGAEFDLHPANDDYAFVHQFEDAAMLFEATMMHFHFQLSRDIAYLDAPAIKQGAECNDYKIAWGMRNRFARDEIKQRAQMVTEALLPNAEWPAYFASLGPPEYLPNGVGWCESVDFASDSVEVNALPQAATGPSLSF